MNRKEAMAREILGARRAGKEGPPTGPERLISHALSDFFGINFLIITRIQRNSLSSRLLIIACRMCTEISNIGL